MRLRPRDRVAKDSAALGLSGRSVRVPRFTRLRSRHRVCPGVWSGHNVKGASGLTTTSQRVGGAYSGSRLTVYQHSGVDGWAGRGRGGSRHDAGRYGGIELAAHQTPAEFNQQDPQGERIAVPAIAWFPGRAVPVEASGDPAVRGRTLIVDGYVRASRPRPWSGSRAAVDRGLIGRWVAGCGWRVGCVFEEPQSAAEPADRRSLLLEALERVESRESDGLVVARFKNLGSSLEEAVAVLERIQAAGGAFVSVCDGIALAGFDGRLLLRLLVSVLDW